MELIRDLDAVPTAVRGGVLSVGVFDGVHLGHQRVLGRAVERARTLGAASVVFTFHPHPLAFLKPGDAPPLIQTFGQKLEAMRRLGVDAVFWPEHMKDVLAMSAEVFVDRVVCRSLAARIMVEGADFRFGAGAGGDRVRLADLAGRCGVEVEFVGDVDADGDRVSSTRIRRLIADGRVAEAARCLGRPYTYVGTVVEGHHRGARLGYPTANVASPRFLLPGEGVYAGVAVVLGKRFRTAVSVGRAPTFEKGQQPVVEAFLMDFEGEIYGEQAALELLAYLRPQETFPDAEALKRQMAADCDRVRAEVPDEALRQA